MCIAWLWQAWQDGIQTMGSRVSEDTLQSSDIYFNEEKIHKRPINMVELHAIVFQEVNQVLNKLVAMDNGQNTPQVQEHREEQQVEKAQPMFQRFNRVSQPQDCYVSSLDYVTLMDCKEPSYYKKAMLR